MDLTGKELTELWTRSEPFVKVALKDFGREGSHNWAEKEFLEEDIEALRKLRLALLDGRYIATGFPEPKRYGDLAIQIPKEAWAPDTSGWQLEIGPGVLGQWVVDGLTICNVRIAVSAHHLTKSGGRPTLGPILRGSINHMVEEKLIDVSKPQKSYFEAIRATAIDLYPMHKAEIEKASDRTISKYFSPVFNSLFNETK